MWCVYIGNILWVMYNSNVCIYYYVTKSLKMFIKLMRVKICHMCIYNCDIYQWEIVIKY